MENLIFVARMRKMFRVVHEELGKDFPSQYLAVVFDVAGNPDTSVGGISKRLGMTSSSVSRAVSALSTWSWTKKQGHGLLEKAEDAYESRRKLVRLNQHGSRFVTLLREAFEEEQFDAKKAGNDA